MRELAELVRTGLKDPRRLHYRQRSRSYPRLQPRHRVLHHFKPRRAEITEEVLEHARGHLRSELAKRIKLSKTPELHFKYDESLNAV